MKPQEYRESYVVITDVPYNVQAGASEGTHTSSGILHLGRVVWLKAHPVGDAAELSAYAEGIGLVTISTDCVSPVKHP